MTVESSDVPEVSRVFSKGREEGLHHGMQIYVSRGGETIADFALGDSEPGVPLSADHRMLWMSSGKPLTAALILEVWQEGRLSLDDPVRRRIREFSGKGTEPITIRHLLTHTGGLRRAEFDRVSLDWAEMIARICETPLEPDWTIGATAGYHVGGSWFLLGEIVARLSRSTFPVTMRERLLDPLHMSETFVGIGEDGPTLPDRFAAVWDRKGRELVRSERCDPESVRSPAPGSNVWGPARDLGRFYQSLLQPQTGILDRTTVEAMISGHRIGQYDETLRHILDWGLGVIRNSARYGPDTVPYGFCPSASSRAFGHGGSQSSIGYADPETGIVVVAIFNGRPGEPRHQRRMREMLAAVERDLLSD